MRVQGEPGATRASEQKRNPRRTGAQKRKERGQRAEHRVCRYVMGRVTEINGRPAKGSVVCCMGLVARHGVLSCPAHGSRITGRWDR